MFTSTLDDVLHHRNCPPRRLRKDCRCFDDLGRDLFGETYSGLKAATCMAISFAGPGTGPCGRRVRLAQEFHEHRELVVVDIGTRRRLRRRCVPPPSWPPSRHPLARRISAALSMSPFASVRAFCSPPCRRRCVRAGRRRAWRSDIRDLIPGLPDAPWRCAGPPRNGKFGE